MSGFLPSLSRRDWLQLSAVGALAAPASGWLPQLASRLHAAEGERPRPKSCILLWLDGGPSQCHTFSLPEENADYGSIDTSVPGITISEHLIKFSLAKPHICVSHPQRRAGRLHRRT